MKNKTKSGSVEDPESIQSDMLGLPGLRSMYIETATSTHLIYAQTEADDVICPYCAHAALVGYGSRDESILDVPQKGKAVQILLNRRRRKCKGCGRTFLEPLPWRHSKHQMTNRLVEYIRRRQAHSSFAGLARETGVNEKTIRNVLKDT